MKEGINSKRFTNQRSMDWVWSRLREKRAIRDASLARRQNLQTLECESRNRDLEELKDERLKCTETIVDNLNSITGHKHTISKVVQQSDQFTGLPISNKFHSQAREIVFDAIKIVNQQSDLDLYMNPNTTNDLDPCNLSSKVQHCAEASADTFSRMKSSVDRVDALMKNIHMVTDSCSDEELGLEVSIFDE